MEAFGYKDELTETTIASQNALQLIAFSIGEQSYGVEITTVREIRAWNGATPLPNTRVSARVRRRRQRTMWWW
jgi:purine-binding chemotaxis protein CheW